MVTWLVSVAVRAGRAAAKREAKPAALASGRTPPAAAQPSGVAVRVTPLAPPAISAVASPPAKTTPALPVVAPTSPTRPADAPFKRLDLLSDEALRKQLLQVTEIALDKVPNTSNALFAAAVPGSGMTYPGPATLLRDRAEFSGLPFVRLADARLRPARAKQLDTLSRTLHAHVQACTAGNGPEARPDAGALRKLLSESREGCPQWNEPGALPALLQILQVEEAPVRQVLVDLLGEMDDPRACSALAVRALVDLSAEVRRAAVRALARRPRRAYRAVLLAGFRYPWPPVAAHAAEALVALRDTAAVGQLEALLDEPPPAQPSPTVANLPGTLAVRELVRVNHLNNCVLCHPPSFQTKDPVRGATPLAGRAVASHGGYGGGTENLFVRADVTFLRQDFSIRQPVARPPANTPSIERFDYLVRVRAPTSADWKRYHDNKDLLMREYRDAIDFALRELSTESPERDSQ
jgi:hypothetical protein